ncbi:hypothetical protein R3P38DRAFT_2775844 [Favolaschia claudopus]|uniref:RNase H type-1 domain-containing protein n=1 Tax=Favolaschia claudopus TaxID=2862362 RepID=A0AAV9Z4P7_9AGAR
MCARTFTRLHPQTRITVTWAPGHVNIAGNERADVLAKRAASTKSSSDDLDISRRLREKLPVSRSATLQAFNAELKSALLPHSLAVLLLQLRTGHIPLAQHLHRIQKTVTDKTFRLFPIIWRFVVFIAWMCQIMIIDLRDPYRYGKNLPPSIGATSKRRRRASTANIDSEELDAEPEDLEIHDKVKDPLAWLNDGLPDLRIASTGRFDLADDFDIKQYLHILASSVEGSVSSFQVADGEKRIDRERAAIAAADSLAPKEHQWKSWGSI